MMGDDGHPIPVSQELPDVVQLLDVNDEGHRVTLGHLVDLEKTHSNR